MLWFNYIFNVENINYGGQSMKKQLINIGACMAISVSLVFAGNYATYAEENDSTVWTETSSETSTENAPTLNSETTLESGTQSLPGTNSTLNTTSLPTVSSTPSASNNIVDIGGYVNIEGLPATLSADGTGVTYRFTVAYQRLHSSDEGQTVSDLLIRVPNIANADVKFTLIGTRDANGNPVEVNAPMSVVDYNDAIENYTGDDEYGIPTAEGLANGKKAYVISGNDYLQDSGKVKSYNLYTTQNHSQAVLVEVTIPMDQAKNIKYLPLDARAEWKASDGSSTIRGFESGCQSLEEYSNHTVTMSGDLENVGGLSDVSLITDEYVNNGHLIKSVSNPNTYITPNNGDWKNIPNDTNIDENTFFAYAKIFTLRANSAVTYYAPISEDMADQDVSQLQLGSVVVDYVIAGEGTSIKATYIDTILRPLYNADGALAAYNTAEDGNEAPQSITYDGKEYTLVGTSAISAPATGALAEGATRVVYEYALAATPTPASTPSTPAASTPKTADTTNLAGYVAALLAAFVAFSVTAVNRYKSNQIF